MKFAVIIIKLFKWFHVYGFCFVGSYHLSLFYKNPGVYAFFENKSNSSRCWDLGLRGPKSTERDEKKENLLGYLPRENKERVNRKIVLNVPFDDAWIVSQIRSSRRESSWCILILKKGQKGLCCTGVALATEPPMPKLERVAQIRKIMLSRCKGYPMCSYLFPSGAPIYIHPCTHVGAPLFYPLGH